MPRPTRKQRGYDQDWMRLRARVLAEHRDCCRCGRRATVVDHIDTIRDAPHKRLDPNNLRAMCTRCHNQRTALDQTHAEKTRLKAAGEDGMPLAKDHPWYRTS